MLNKTSLGSKISTQKSWSYHKEDLKEEFFLGQNANQKLGIKGTVEGDEWGFDSAPGP